MKSLKIILKFLYLKFKSHIAFRTDTVLQILFGILDTLFAFLFFNVIYSYVDNVVGFEKGEIYILTGTAYLLDTLHRSIFGTGIFSLSILVKSGRLEKYLIRPFKPNVLVAFREPRFDMFYRLPSYFVLFIYGFYLLKTFPSFFDILLFFTSFSISSLIYIFLSYNITLLTFWIIEVYNLYYIIYDFYEFARYPEKIYKGIFRKIFITIIPVIILSNYPVKFLLKERNYFFLFYQIFILFIFFLIFKLMWKRGLRRYEGATI
ncbi:MAG: ABC-2 family transporter protein [Candidatus Hydrothermales bacterium]